MAEGRKSHLSQGGRGNGIQERERSPHSVNDSLVCSILLPGWSSAAGGLIRRRYKDESKITSMKGLSIVINEI